MLYSESFGITLRKAQAEIGKFDEAIKNQTKAVALSAGQDDVLPEMKRRLDLYKQHKPVLFYCRLGARSGMAANAFRRAGYDAYSLDGGLTEWDRRELPLDPEDGTVAEH